MEKNIHKPLNTKILMVGFSCKKLDELIRQRIPVREDKTVWVFDKKGKKHSLFDDKIKYPYKIDTNLRVFIWTQDRRYEIIIHEGYRWNGADIPALLWAIIGSKDDIRFKVGSLVHDFMLEFKEYCYKYCFGSEMSVSQYRKMTSDILRFCVEKNGTSKLKSWVMRNAVEFWQMTFERKKWKELEN